MRAAPSSMEYSVCTCRWTKLLSEAGWDDIGRESMPPERHSLYAVPSPHPNRSLLTSGRLRGRKSAAEPVFAHFRPVARAKIGRRTGLCSLQAGCEGKNRPPNRSLLTSGRLRGQKSAAEPVFAHFRPVARAKIGRRTGLK